MARNLKCETCRIRLEPGGWLSADAPRPRCPVCDAPLEAVAHAAELVGLPLLRPQPQAHGELALDPFPTAGEASLRHAVARLHPAGPTL